MLREMYSVMKFLTAHNDLILDPFVGGGSTAIACMNLKRRFVGIDIDPTALERAKANLRVNLEISNKGRAHSRLPVSTSIPFSSL